MSNVARDREINALLEERYNIETGMCVGVIWPVEGEKRKAEIEERITELVDGEVRTTSRTGGQKGVKLARYDLIPVEPLRMLAEHYGRGAEKYDENQYRKGYEFSKSYAALQRHLNQWWGGEDNDEELGSSHLVSAAWHCFTLLTFMQEHPEFDDRFTAEL